MIGYGRLLIICFLLIAGGAEVFAQDNAVVQRIHLLEYDDTDGSFRTAFIDGEVLEVSFDGVVLREVSSGQGNDDLLGQTTRELIPWYGVIDGFGFETGDQEYDSWIIPDEYSEFARESALGFARRKRGDYSGAAGLYRGLSEDLAGSDSAQALEVFTGLYEDAVLRLDFVDASAAVSLYGSSQTLNQWYRNREWVDERYGVDTRIPMIPGLTTKHFLLSPVDVEALEEGSASRLIHEGYRAVESDGYWEVCDQWSDTLGEVRDGSPNVRLAVELYSMMVEAQKHPDPEQRATARNWLSARSGIRRGTWMDAWCRLGVGVSLMNEGRDHVQMGQGTLGSELCSRAVIEFVHVMLRFRVSHPMLAELALHHAVEGLNAFGRVEESSGLMESFDQYGLEGYGAVWDGL